MKKPLPIGIDDFEKIRSKGYYYVDKSLMIQRFLEMQDEVALITRPRRFGKTLNMTMLREFFDITKNSTELFDGLKIMDTPYGTQMNTRPVIYFTFKNCKGASAEEMAFQMRSAMRDEYHRYYERMKQDADRDKIGWREFMRSYESIENPSLPYYFLSSAILDITRAVYEFYGVRPILLIDEYDQPIMSSYEYGYHDQLSAFFSNFYGAGMKGNAALDQALVTGVQRVAKESIFSQFNNPQVYTVISDVYAEFFGLSAEETESLLKEFGLEMDDQVKAMYNGYVIGGNSMYNPWSVINYAKTGLLDNYWLKTSANFLVKQALGRADRNFWKKFDCLAQKKSVEVTLTLDTSYAERDGNYSLWGLLVNAGYLTVTKRTSMETAVVKIPNEEVMSEFQILVSELSGIEHLELTDYFRVVESPPSACDYRV